MVETIHDYQEEPKCCSRVKVPGKMLWPRLDPGITPIHMIKLLKDPEVTWNLPTKPLETFEIWDLRNRGRQNGEKIGVIGVRQTVVEWVMTPGVAIGGGFSDTIEMAVASMLEALQGGVFAHQYIQPHVVS